MSKAVVTLPDGREALFIVMDDNGMRFGNRVARAAGALHWMLPNKAMCDAISVRFPDWPPNIWAWQVTRRDVAALTWPGHDPAPLRATHNGRGDRGPWYGAHDAWAVIDA